MKAIKRLTLLVLLVLYPGLIRIADVGWCFFGHPRAKMERRTG